MNDQELLDAVMVFFGNLNQLSTHLGIAGTTGYRWRSGRSKIPTTARLLLEGYLKHPGRYGEDLAMLADRE